MRAALLVVTLLLALATPPAASAATPLVAPAPTTLNLLPLPDVPSAAVESEVPDVEVIRARIEKRTKMVKAHQGLGALAAISMFTAQGFGLFNRIALGEGLLTRDELAPTLNLHRVFVSLTLVSYASAGVVALAMPGPGGTRASKGLIGGPRVLRNVHIGLSIAHAVAMATTLTTGILQAHVYKDTPAWDGLVTTHHIAASTTAGLLLTAAFVIR